MTHLYRLMVCMLFVLMPSLASAALSPAYQDFGPGSGGPFFSTPLEACKSIYPSTVGTYHQGGGAYPCEGQYGTIGVVYGFRLSCPDHSVSTGNTCTCDKGYVEENGACKFVPSVSDCDGLAAFCTGLKGEKINLEGKGTATPPGCSADSQRPNCAMGCAGEAVGMGVSYKTSDGSWMTGQEYRVTGGTCTLPAPSDVPQKKESDCAGSVGEVNGIRTCVPNQAATGDTSSKETKNPDGTSSNTESKTTCENGVCKTTNTTTTKDASGNTTSTSTSSSSTSQREYCASNKASTVCAATNGDKNPSDKDGSDKGEKCEGDDCEDKPGKFEGSCMAGFSCEGDALQCAQTREQHRRNCELFEKDTDGNSLTNKALNGTDDKSAEALKASAGQVNVTSTFDQSGLGWSHSCPADPRIPLGFGGSNSEFSIPFSRICGPLGVLSLAGVGITLLGCGVWVLGGKKGS